MQMFEADLARLLTLMRRLEDFLDDYERKKEAKRVKDEWCSGGGMR